MVPSWVRKIFSSQGSSLGLGRFLSPRVSPRVWTFLLPRVPLWVRKIFRHQKSSLRVPPLGLKDISSPRILCWVRKILSLRSPLGLEYFSSPRVLPWVGQLFCCQEPLWVRKMSPRVPLWVMKFFITKGPPLG